MRPQCNNSRKSAMRTTKPLQTQGPESRILKLLCLVLSALPQSSKGSPTICWPPIPSTRNFQMPSAGISTSFSLLTKASILFSLS